MPPQPTVSMVRRNSATPKFRGRAAVVFISPRHPLVGSEKQPLRITCKLLLCHRLEVNIKFTTTTNSKIPVNNNVGAHIARCPCAIRRFKAIVDSQDLGELVHSRRFRNRNQSLFRCLRRNCIHGHEPGELARGFGSLRGTVSFSSRQSAHFACFNH